MGAAGSAGAQVETDTPDTAEQHGASPPLPEYVPYETASEKKRVWEFTIAPYLMFPFMTGSLTLRNQPVEVNVNTGQILRALNWGIFLYFEARHPKFSLITDVFYASLGHGALLPASGRSADLSLQQLITDVLFLGRITSWFELGFGGRVNFIQSDLTAPEGMVLPAVNIDVRQTWFDPLVAMRFSVPFKDPHWRLGISFDFGGFALGSTYAWKVQPYGGYRLAGSGYR